MASLEDLGKELQAKYPAYKNKDPLDLGRRAKAKNPQKYAAYSESSKGSAIKTGLDLLPAVGGLAGGAIGGAGGTLFGLGVGGIPGAIGGATAGGAGGEALKQLLEHALTAGGVQGVEGPQSMGAAAGSIGKEGAVQGALEGTGQGVFAAGRALAKPIYALGARVTPDIAKVAIQEGVAATKGGLNRLMSRIGQAGDATRALVQGQTNYGTRISGLHLARQVFQDLAPDVAEQPIKSPTMYRLRRLVAQYVGDHPLTLTPTRVHVMKQRADQLASAVYAKLEKGLPVTAREEIEAKFNKAFADRAREVLDMTVNGYKEANTRTQQLIGVKNAIWPTVEKGESAVMGALRRVGKPAGGAAVGATIGAISSPEHTRGAIAGGLVGGALGTPEISSQIARGLSSPALQASLRRIPHYGQVLSQLAADNP